MAAQLSRPELGLHEHAADALERPRPYARYALTLLFLANAFNYIDRTIVSALAKRIQEDLHLTDAALGFILGTAFAILYGVLGVAMGRIADALRRIRVMAFGLALWSLMTALSSAATGFAGLAAARVGVGVGEATATPCSTSLLSDYFPARKRSAVLGTYLASVHIGNGAALIIGGLLIQHWSSLCHTLPADACRLTDWRAACLVVGLPGLVIAALIMFLHDPVRPAADPSLRPLKRVVDELLTAVPPFTFINLFRIGGPPALANNLLLAAAVTLCGTCLGYATGDWLQWIAVAVGVYSVTTWAQVLRRTDRPLHEATFGSPVFVRTMFGGALLTCFVGTVAVWSPLYAMRILHAKPSQVGISIGLVQGVSAAASVIIGGIITDRWKRTDNRAPLWIGVIAVLLPIPALVGMLHAITLEGFSGYYALFTLFSMCWAGAFAALAQDIVPQRMRSSAAAIFALVMILIGSGIGPYWVGKISTITGSLTTGLYSLLVFVPAVLSMMFMAAARLRKTSVLA